jgi:GNAT superfamily N-acetyltransferase
VRILPFRPRYLLALQRLVNVHLSAAVPGWTLSADYLAQHLDYDDTEDITEPWVTERTTLLAVDRGQLLAAGRLLRYGDGAKVSASYRGVGTISWLVARPDRPDSAAALLKAAEEQFAAWQVSRVYGWDTGLPVYALWGVPDCWPHIADALSAAGYLTDLPLRRAALYGGTLAGIPEPGGAPIAGLTLRRTAGAVDGPRFAALLNGQELGYCEWNVDLSRGGLLPGMRGWTCLEDLLIEQGWRNQGIGSWIVQHGVAWARQAGCDRVIMDVADENERAGAGRFYRLFGWEVFVVDTHGWLPAAS